MHDAASETAVVKQANTASIAQTTTIRAIGVGHPGCSPQVYDFANSNEIFSDPIVSSMWRSPGQTPDDSPPLMRSDTWLRDRHHNRAKTLVEAELAGGVTDDNKIISAVVQALQVDRIELDPVREYLEQPWIRVLDASPELNHAEVRRGIYPGQRYKLAYDRYRLRLVSGAELVTLAANGGPAMLDSTFVGYVDGCIEIRADNDRHRDQLIGWVESYIVEANRIIDKWNGPNLDQLVRNEVRRQQQQRSAAEQTRPHQRRRWFRASCSGRTTTRWRQLQQPERLDAGVTAARMGWRERHSRQNRQAPPRSVADKHVPALSRVLAARKRDHSW